MKTLAIGLILMAVVLMLMIVTMARLVIASMETDGIEPEPTQRGAPDA